MSKDAEVMALKPTMELVPSPISKEWKRGTAIRFDNNTTAQAKADGEFNVLYYNKRGQTFTKNKYGRVETAETLPAILDFVKVMRKQPIETAVFLVEMHVFHKKLLRVSDFIHYLKGNDESLKQHIRLGFFRMVSVDGTKINEPAQWQFEEMESFIGTQKRLLVLPWTKVKSQRDIEQVWNKFVDKMGYEGLIVRNYEKTYKLKPEIELDAVVVALNKNDGYSKRRGTSLRLAIMVDEETFLEIGDVASGITHDLRKVLWQLKEEFGIEETKDKYYVQPIAVAQIVCHDIFQKQMRCWKLENGRIVDLGTRLSITMRHPKLITFREDKSVTPKDIGLQQIPRGRYDNENYGV